MKNKITALTLSLILALSSTSAFGAERLNTNININNLLKDYGFFYSEPTSKDVTTENTYTEVPAEYRAEAPAEERAATTETAETAETSAPAASNYEQKVAELVNIERQKNGLAPLTLDSTISDVARMKSKDMSDNNYFAHQSPTYGSAGDMLTKFGVKWSAWGENIAAGQRTPEEVVNAWMNSEGHRANILSPNFSKIGVGYVNNGRPNWTQMFTN
jgi:uncharacterized YkwD family protein